SHTAALHSSLSCVFFSTDPSTTEIYTLSLHDALPIYEDGEEAAPSGPPLDEASVPAANSVVRASGRTIVRISLGVMRRTISVLRSEEHTSELQSLRHLVCRLLLEKKKNTEKVQLCHRK